MRLQRKAQPFILVRMHASMTWFQQRARGLTRKRHLFPMLVFSVAGALFVSEDTYNKMTATVADGNAFTDSRARSARLLQLLADVKTAEYGYLLTGQPEFVTQFEEARQELPNAQSAVSRFLTDQGPVGKAAAQTMADVTEREVAQVNRSFELVRAGDTAAAVERASLAASRTEIRALRQTLQQQLDQAASLQSVNRAKIYDSLWLGRVVVGLLTLATLATLLMLFMQLRRQIAERREERERLAAEVQCRTDRLTELASYLQSVREDERSRIARELHDELGALLTVSKLEIARARNRASNNAEVLTSLARVTAFLNKGIALKRRIIEDLTPSSLTQLGLTVALETLCADMSVSLALPVNVSMVSLQLRPAAELAVYRFVQEALTNIGKYAKASWVTVRLAAADGHAAVEVQDDGVGFDSCGSHIGRHGLSGMQFRAESLGGLMSVRSAPGEGTTLRIEFPQAPGSHSEPDVMAPATGLVTSPMPS
jgi:signal transduction histidine kinase